MLAAASLGAVTARAACSTPTPKVCSRFFASDAVFVAQVVSKSYVDDRVNIRFDVRVSRVLRGSAQPEESVYTGNDTGRLIWNVGREYVVFAKRDNGRLKSWGDCGPIGDEYQNVAAIVSQIRALGQRRTASIEGEILLALGHEGMRGVPVRVTNGTTTYRATSNRKGEFRIDVPPGSYRVRPDASVKESDLNVEGLNVRLVAGQCAQYTFLARNPVGQ